MSEMENTADHLIVIGRGKLIADWPVAEFTADGTALATTVKTPVDILPRLKAGIPAAHFR
jgi:ABC-2 type transport system ATP-binding protein